MKISIVVNKWGKTTEETKPYAVVGPVPDDCWVLNECEIDTGHDELVKSLLSNDCVKECYFCEKDDWGEEKHGEYCPFSHAYRIRKIVDKPHVIDDN